MRREGGHSVPPTPGPHNEVGERSRPGWWWAPPGFCFPRGSALQNKTPKVSEKASGLKRGGEEESGGFPWPALLGPFSKPRGEARPGTKPLAAKSFPDPKGRRLAPGRSLPNTKLGWIPPVPSMRLLRSEGFGADLDSVCWPVALTSQLCKTFRNASWEPKLGLPFGTHKHTPCGALVLNPSSLRRFLGLGTTENCKAALSSGPRHVGAKIRRPIGEGG